MVQLRTSRQYKMRRLQDIAESEDLYFGVVKPSIRNPFNDSFPYMSGFVDTLVSKLDDPPEAEISESDEADYISAKKYQAAFDQEVNNSLPFAQWARKDRWCRKMAIFSGVGVYKVWGENCDGEFRFNFEIVDYYDFHCEPGGGGDLETHIFKGEESVFKTKEELIYGVKKGIYDEYQVQKIITLGNASEYKQNQDEYNTRLNRHRAMGLDPQSNNYTGQVLYKFCQWVSLYDGVQYYNLFEANQGVWIRLKLLRELFPIVPQLGEALSPYVAWQTHEDPRVFWCKAPADDARPVAKSINRILNQELYNREKKNHDQRFYDPEMFYDVEALQSQQLDGLIPFDSKGGNRKASEGIYKVSMGEISGSIELVSFLDSYSGQKTGTTPGSQGAAPSDQKVGIYFGELKQIEGRLGLYNKSYKEAWQQIVYRFIQAIDMHVTKPMAIKMYGAAGLTWDELTPNDKKRVRDFGIRIKGGQDELAENMAKNERKNAALAALQTVNPQWKEKELLKNAGYTEEEIKDAFSMIPAGSKELMAEAAQAVDDIARGRRPKLNPGANLAFMEKLIDAGKRQNDAAIANEIYDYASAHAPIVAANEARSASAIMSERLRNQALGPNQDGTAISPDGGNGPVDSVDKPIAPVASTIAPVEVPPGLPSEVQVRQPVA